MAKIYLEPIFEISRCQWLQRDDLPMAKVKDNFEPERPAYLYCILSKNRIKINHKFISFTDDNIQTEFLIDNKGEIIKEQIALAHKYTDLKEVNVISEFPYTEFKIVDENGDTLFGGKTAYFLEHNCYYSQIRNKHLLDYEILYIGQSIISNTNVPVLNRMMSHKTFQKILEDHNRFHPDKEVFLFLFSFRQKAFIDIPEDATDIEREEFAKNFTRNHLNPSSKDIRQNVTLFETALINYFKPKYNNQFTKNSPNKKHLSFSNLHAMNLRKVRITFGIENCFPKLYTKSVSKSSEYNIEYEIE